MIKDFPDIVILENRFIALPQKVIYWQEENALLVADVHLGKSATFRVAGVPIPEGSTDEDLQRLSDALEITGAKTVYFLGDLTHHRTGKTMEVIGKLQAWFARNTDKDFHLMTGNHDRHSGPLDELPWIKVHEELVIQDKFMLRHYPEKQPGYYVLSGHLHPSVRLKGRGGERLRLACSVFKKNLAILQAFGSFTGNSTHEPKPGETIFIAHNNEVFRLGI